MRLPARAALTATAALALVWTLYGQAGAARENAYRENNIGVAYLERYDYSAAAAAFRRALKIDPSVPFARVNLAIAQLYGGSLDEAADSARTALATEPQSPHAHFVSGLIGRAQNRTNNAIAAFERVLALDPRDAGSRIHLGQLHTSERRHKEAAALFIDALAQEPFNATAAYGLATALGRDGQREAGASAMQRFQTLRDNPAAITYSANYLEQGRYGEAVASSGLEPDLVDTAVPPVTFTDATAEVMGDANPSGWPSLLDADNDGDLDLIVSSEATLTLRINNAGRLETARAIDSSAPGATGAIAGDWNNDGRPDLFVIGTARDRLYRQQADGGFVLAPLGDGGASAAAAFADVDHDGDLDIIVSPPHRIWRNNGDATFSDITAATGVEGSSRLSAIVPTDFDNRRDIDLLLVPASGAPALFANRRDGTFANVAQAAGLPTAASYTAAATADLNKDGTPDFVLARTGAPAAVAMSAAGGRFAIDAAPDDTRDASVLQVFDYDGDGLQDLLASVPSGAKLWRNLGRSWSDVTSAALPLNGPRTDARPVVMAVGDLDLDGDYDVVLRLASGRIQVWRNARTGPAMGTLRVRLEPRVSNRSALGAKIEVRAGSLRDRFELTAATPAIAPANVVFGLGRRTRADALRVLWPSGILQAEPNPGSSITVTELNRKPSSCPFLFTWNGSAFEFATDFLGGGEMGAWLAPGVRNMPDPDEYVRIPSRALVARDGRYELRVTNELEEALFLDRVQLMVVDHPDVVDVYPNEGLRSPEGRTPFAIHTVRSPRPPIAAVDHHGHDVLARVRAIDRQYADDFRLENIQGYAEPHSLTLDFGVVAARTRALLLLTGWTDYAFSSDNVAASQRSLAAALPALEIQKGDGTWRPIDLEVGIPVGRPQTIAMDLTSQLPATLGRVKLRVSTSLRVYWDQILLDLSEPAPVEVVRLDAASADFRWRGFSAELPIEGIGPSRYDYAKTTPWNPWKTMPGRYTRYGDVVPLLRSADDMFVVSSSGDELALSFDAASLPPLRPGWTRTFLFFADGFSKEMNLYSSSPDALEPLPFHTMTRYPYAPPERYPQTPAHDRYRAEYNTRIVGGPLPPLLFTSTTAR
ncbi:MAG TPA: FG-GAP-like repeat-containing protein [Vicinamibacterales bacterium]|nr:FG-GAP-like repeat-containing protein [Vicinamibacterales bacterium]